MMVGQITYPVLFGTTRASWAPIDRRVELFTGEADPDRIAGVEVVLFVGAACVGRVRPRRPEAGGRWS